jgi:hypothetical protein
VDVGTADVVVGINAGATEGGVSAAGNILDTNRSPDANATLLPADVNSLDTIGFFSIFTILSNMPEPPITLIRTYLFLRSIIIY